MGVTTDAAVAAIQGHNGEAPHTQSARGRFRSRVVRRLSYVEAIDQSPRGSPSEQGSTEVVARPRALKSRLARAARSAVSHLNLIGALRRALARSTTPYSAATSRGQHLRGDPPASSEQPGIRRTATHCSRVANRGATGAAEPSLHSGLPSPSTPPAADPASFAPAQNQANPIATVRTRPAGPSALPPHPAQAWPKAHRQAEAMLQSALVADARAKQPDQGEHQRLPNTGGDYVPRLLLEEFEVAIANAQATDAELDEALRLLNDAAKGGLGPGQRQELSALQASLKARVSAQMFRVLDLQQIAETSQPPTPTGRLLSRYFRARSLDRGLFLIEEIMPRIRQLGVVERASGHASLRPNPNSEEVGFPRSPDAAPQPSSASRPSGAKAQPVVISPAGPALAQANGIELAYNDTGGGGPAIVLIRGLGTQMTEWSPALIDGLRQQGLRVITFDNRDAGLSAKMDAEYPLREMADDVAGLLDHLGVARAHVFGISLGGMVAQLLAYHHPGRVLSLCSVMSSSGNPDLPPIDPQVMSALLRQADNKDDIVRIDAENRELCGSPGYPESLETRLSAAQAAYERCHYPQGVARQMQAVFSDGSRVDRLGQIDAPTLVIHGAADKLLSPECGRDTARCVPRAELQVVDGMGHNIPDALAPQIAARVGGFIGRCATAPPQAQAS